LATLLLEISISSFFNSCAAVILTKGVVRTEKYKQKCHS